jgi:hypothetical protein
MQMLTNKNSLLSMVRLNINLGTFIITSIKSRAAKLVFNEEHCDTIKIRLDRIDRAL